MKKQLLVMMAFGTLLAQAGNIEQTVQFNNATPEKVFNLFTNAKDHGAALGAPAKIGAQAGDEYSAFGGNLKGKTITSTPGYQLVLAWRGSHFPAGTPDSILVLTFVKNESGSEIEMVHVNVPDSVRAEVNTHWNTFYWDPWKKYVASLKD